MKGQYLAVQTVLTFGMGLLVASGSIAVFSNYKSEVLGEAREKQVNVVEARTLRAVHSLQEVDSGRVTVDLPEQIAGDDYSISLGEKLVVSVQQRTYTTGLNWTNNTYSFSGSVSGGDVKLFKSDEQFTLRAG